MRLPMPVPSHTPVSCITHEEKPSPCRTPSEIILPVSFDRSPPHISLNTVSWPPSMPFTAVRTMPVTEA